MDEKRCEWCGTLSPAEAEKCTLCRIPFGAPVPPPQDWSHLTGNIPVITAPLLETPGEAPARGETASAPVVPQQVQREAVVPTPVLAPQPASTSAPEEARVAAGFTVPNVPSQADLVPAIGEMATEPARSETSSVEAPLPGWRTPEDPTLRVFADVLDQRERRSASGGSNRRARRRRRRQLARLAVWLIALGLVAAVVVLAPSRLPSF